MPGGQAVVTATPVAGEPFQFTLSAADSLPLEGEAIDRVAWTAGTSGLPPIFRNNVEFTNEFDGQTQATLTYTAVAVVKFTDGSVDTQVVSFTVPHNVS